jgi:hypothetical protein
MILMAGEETASLERWAAKVKMPWPMVKEKDHMRMRKIKDLAPRGWPTYYLVDQEGEVLAKSVGSSAHPNR